MRLKLLLFSMLMVSGALYAQTDDTIRHVIISEARLGEAPFSYVEITNVGTVDVDLLDFEFGRIGPWTDPYAAGEDQRMIIGEYLNTYQPGRSTILPAGESFTIAMVYDFNQEMWPIDPDHYQEKVSKSDWEGFADIEMHYNESNAKDANDSISPKYSIMEVWNGRDCWYLRYHVGGDSAVIDQVGGMFNGDNGRNVDYPYAVAGFPDATLDATLVRKFSVAEGNLDFSTARGLDLTDSEWMPIERQIQGGEQYYKLFWTAGNHGDYNLTESSLVPKAGKTVDVDWTNYVITVPWGTRNHDSVMMCFEYTPGLAWHYTLNGQDPGDRDGQGFADSAFVSARTGDSLTVYACGNDLDEAIFKIEVAAPTDGANLVMPKGRLDYEEGWFGRYGTDPVYRVSDGVPGMDTISRVPFSTRIDSLLKYLEKAPEASWEIDFVDGENTRVDLLDGDKLVVTAQNGATKEYYIKVQEYRKNQNALLSAITWPDIPQIYKSSGLYGWKGDTIPNFESKTFNYTVRVMEDQVNVPGLKAIPEELNTKVEVTRAVSLYGSTAHRTVSFKATAEDDTTTYDYNVLINRVLDAQYKQPWVGEPFISQFVFQDQWQNNFIEICNPGTEPLDMSYYMMFYGYTNDPVEAITGWNETDAWENRYIKYIPGRKWELQADWETEPRMVISDPVVSPIVQGGDVFVLGRNWGASQLDSADWWVWDLVDIDFAHNPWGESLNTDNVAGGSWHGANFYLWKIVNDSVRNGLKAATDPADFNLIETWGTGDGSEFAPTGVGAGIQTVSWMRKPEYFEGKTGFNESFGASEAESEWYMRDRGWGDANGMGWPEDILYITRDLGQHYMNEVTVGMSTVLSVLYKVSPGFSMDEEILGLTTGTTRDQFLTNIYKKDEGQVLTVIKGDGTGDTLKVGTDVIVDGDSLIVLSADASNSSKYFLSVTAEGLSSNATLESSTYTVAVDGATGTVGGFDYGTTLASVVNGVTVPDGAKMYIIDEQDRYVSMVTYDFDTAMVNTLATDAIFFEVTAEDGVTKILYQLTPNATDADANVYSAVYSVDQDSKLISLVPKGTTVPTFMSHIVPSTGASVELLDKASFTRTSGTIYKDDKLFVTAADGVTTNTYYLQLLEEDVVDYLSYVLSDVYIVDQDGLNITSDPATDINEGTLVSDFLDNLTPAPGATAAVYQEGAAKETTDDMDAGDVLMVVAANGINVTTYTVAVDPSSVNDLTAAGISVYPNPSSGLVNVAGLEMGSRIQVYNALGARVIDNVVDSNFETISLEDNEKGFYFMVVSNEQGVLGHFKLVIE